jgi:hypothetical protein
MSNVPAWVRDPGLRAQCKASTFLWNIDEQHLFCISWNTQLWLLMCNVIQITMATFTLVLFCAVRVPVAYKSSRQSGGTLKDNLYEAFFGSGAYYYIGYLTMAILGLEYPFCNAILLLDLIAKNADCRNIVNAVTQNFTSLMTSWLLMMFMMYIFAFWFFDQYYDNFKYGECQTLARCCLVMLNFGMRNGGGLADYLYDEGVGPVNELSQRYVVDKLYFFFVGIIMLNIVFGIIIDTYSELRETKLEKEEKRDEFCFICGIERNKFDQLGPNEFENHIADGGDHDMWAYLKFIVFIIEQDADDDDGLESFIREAIDTGNLDWIPHGKALALVHYEDEEMTVEDTAGAMIQKMKADFMAALATIKSEQEEKHKVAMEKLQDATDRIEAQQKTGGGDTPQLSLMTMAKLKMRARAHSGRASQRRVTKHK